MKKTGGQAGQLIKKHNPVLMNKQHHYHLSLDWTGNTGRGTENYLNYKRDHVIKMVGKPAIALSSDPAFMGDPSKYNPEELLLASLSSCHMLWYLHLCVINNVIVLKYSDHPEGIMDEEADGSGKFTKVILKPEVIVLDKTMISTALELHKEANKKCFIANSMNFTVLHQAIIRIKKK